MSRPAYVLRYGVLAVGVPLAVALNVLTLVARGDPALFWSVRNAFELTYTLALVAPTVGVAAGIYLWIWRVGGPDWPTAAPVPIRPAIAVPAPAPRTAQARSDRMMELDADQRSLSALGRRLQQLAARDPGRLRTRVVLFTLLGYAYIVGSAAVLVAATVWLLWFDHGVLSRLTPFAAGTALMVLSALIVRVKAPAGQRVTRAGSPALLDLVEKIARTLQAPVPDVVLVTNDFNASVTEVPRRSVFGLPTRYLSVGLPLLDAMSTAEAGAVLAHEMAHLARGDSEAQTWVARLSVSWQLLALRLEAGGNPGRVLFLPFFRWYTPRFAIYGQTMSQSAERDSDSLAAKFAGAEEMATALLRLHVYQRFLTERFLPSVYAESAQSAEPPAGVVAAMQRALRAGADHDDLVRWTREILAERSLDSRSHPCLRDRLDSLGVPTNTDARIQALAAQAFGPRPRNAPEDLLSSMAVGRLVERLDDDWQQQILPQWRTWSGCAAIWQSGSAGAANDPFVQWAHARWAADCAARSEAISLLRKTLGLDPRDADLELRLGRLLTDSTDATEREEGVRLLENAAQRDNRLALEACTLLETQYARAGRHGDQERVQARRQDVTDEAAASWRERLLLRAEDPLAPWPIPAPVLDRLRRICEAIPTIRQAAAVRKSTQHLQEQMLVAFVLVCDVPWYRPSTSSTAPSEFQRMLDRIPVPADVDRVSRQADASPGLRRRIQRMPGAVFYERTSGR